MSSTDQQFTDQRFVDPTQPDRFGPDDRSDKTGEIVDRVSAAVQTAKDHVETAAAPMVDQAWSAAEEQKKGGADRINEVAGAVHTAADEIGKQVPQVARYIHSGAEQLEKASRLLRENSIDDLLKMTNRLAHDRPIAFIGGSVAAGFVLARFLKTSNSATTNVVPGSRS